VAELNTGSANVTPTLNMEDGDIALAAFNNATRATVVTEIARMGRLVSVTFAGDFTAAKLMHRLELVMRELTMEVFVQGVSQSFKVSGKTSALATALVFDIPEAIQDINQTTGLFVVDRLSIEANTGSVNITPTLNGEDGNISVTAVNTATRSVVTTKVNRLSRLNSVTLTSDFSAARQMHRIQLVLRPLQLEVVTSDGQGFQLQGRTDNLASSVIFDMVENNSFMNQTASVIVFDRLSTEMDTASTNITPALNCEDGDISVTAVNTATRTVVTTEINRLGRLNSVTYSGDFTAAVLPHRLQLHVRPLLLELEIKDAGKKLTIPGRTQDLTSLITFDLQEAVSEFNQTSRLYVFDRVAIEANTASGNITPAIGVEGTDMTLTAVNTASRTVTIENIDRIGRLEEFTLSGDFSAAVQLHRVNLLVREAFLELIETESGQRTKIPGYSADLTASIRFEITENLRELNQLNSLIAYQHYVMEVDSGATELAMTLEKPGGTETSVAAAAYSGRQFVDGEINTNGPLRAAVITGDFTAADVKWYGLELSMRKVVLQITGPSGSFTVDGRTNDFSTSIEFDIDPYDRRLEGFGGVLQLERLILDYQGVMTPSLTTIGGNSQALTVTAGASRGSVEYDLRRPVMPRLLTLTGDFSTVTNTLFGAELFVRPLPMGIHIVGR
jgi:Fe-S cluster biogenesis protein NfuA